MFTLKKEYIIPQDEKDFLLELQKKTLDAICDDNTRYTFKSKENQKINNMWLKYIAPLECKDWGHDFIKLEKKEFKNRCVIECKQNILNNVLLCNANIQNEDILRFMLGVRECYQVIYKYVYEWVENTPAKV